MGKINPCSGCQKEIFAGYPTFCGGAFGVLTYTHSHKCPVISAIINTNNKPGYQINEICGPKCTPEQLKHQGLPENPYIRTGFLRLVRIHLNPPSSPNLTSRL